MEKRLANSGKVGIRKVVITGPESTGKTALTQQLAHHFNTIWIPEYAREYVENLGNPYVYEDLIKITNIQINKLREVTEKPNQFIFLDTDLIIMKVWFQEAFQNYPEWLHDSIKQRNIDLYLLCATDISWMSFFPDSVSLPVILVKKSFNYKSISDGLTIIFCFIKGFLFFL